MRPLRAVLVPYSVHTGGKSEAQLTKKQAVLLMHDKYKKHMVNISPRVQRLIVRSFPYQPFNVTYKKGKDIAVADALSRVTPMDPEDNIKLPIIAVNLITAHILLSAHPQDTFSRKLD